MIITALALGFFGSLHCAGMCGPLVLAMGAPRTPNGEAWRGKLIYHGGRLITYVLLGLLLGLLGHGVSMAGLQQWTSLSVGSTMLLAAWLPYRWTAQNRWTRRLPSPHQIAAGWLGNPSPRARFRFGMLNGFLPCGLVYAACAGAVASQENPWQGALYMLSFGAGTLPMMLALGVVWPRLSLVAKTYSTRWVPATLAIVGALLILRGLDLGIPYLSPALTATGVQGGVNCH